MLFLTALWGKSKLYIIGAVALAIAFFSFTKYEQHVGADKVKDKDRKLTGEAVDEKRKIERRVALAHVSDDDERRIMRDQRNKLRGILQSK